MFLCVLFLGSKLVVDLLSEGADVYGGTQSIDSLVGRTGSI